MIVLGLDTTGPDCSVSIVDDAVVRAHISRNIGRGHAEVLAGMVAEVFERAGLTPQDVDRLAVCTGPGSFTGLRVALSFAKGFALPRDVPVLGMDALQVKANDLLFSSGETGVGIMRDIRRGEIFLAAYDYGIPLDPPKSVPFEAAQDLSHELKIDIHDAGSIDTRILAWLAIDCDPEDFPAEPVYSRGPDAKLPGGKSL
jgi:tRNA threonylcarbamoyl adenosine modification protein YeaZ